MVSAVTITHEKDFSTLEVMLKSLPESVECVIVETLPSTYVHQGKPERITLQGREVIYSEYYYANGYFSFSNARNYAKSLATREWVLSIDSDEKLLSDLSLIKDVPESVGGIYTLVTSFVPYANSWQSSPQLRLFRNKGTEWQFSCHEQVLPSIERQGLKTMHSDIILQHAGYSSEETVTAKLKRNLPLMYRDLAANPYNPYLTKKLKESLEYLWQS